MHLSCNEKGGLRNFMITLGDIDDYKPLEREAFIDFIYGKLFGDKLIRSHCRLLSVSKEAVHQCTKDH